MKIGALLTERFADNEVVKGKYIPELVQWMKIEI